MNTNYKQILRYIEQYCLSTSCEKCVFNRPNDEFLVNCIFAPKNPYQWAEPDEL